MPRNFFQEQREALGLSQRAMATRLGVSNTAVGLWERFRGIPTPTVAELAAAYKVPAQRIEEALTVQRRAMEARADKQPVTAK